MTDHLTNSQMKRFFVRALPLDEMTAAAEHLDKCPKCYDPFTETLQSRRGDAKLSFALTPEFAFRHEHVDYEQLVALADHMLDSTGSQMRFQRSGQCIMRLWLCGWPITIFAGYIQRSNVLRQWKRGLLKRFGV